MIKTCHVVVCLSIFFRTMKISQKLELHFGRDLLG